MPNVLCDFHEMGTNSTYFSNQENPSNQSAYSELNQVLTRKIAGYHAKALDKIGSSYFVEENYDDFIMAKDPPTLTSMVP
jgi:hypothetical protein